MIKIFLALLIISCASSRKVSFPSTAEITVKDFSSAKEAQNFIRNKWNYFTLLFEQSHDPYYGTPKWPADCLKTNNFSKVQEAFGNVFFDSQLFLNNSKEPGFCSGNLRDVIFLHCKDEPRIHEIVCPAGTCRNLLQKNPCPVKK